jgi:poly-beta-1,6-N-acetyl-D-glucosamine synthase
MGAHPVSTLWPEAPAAAPLAFDDVDLGDAEFARLLEEIPPSSALTESPQNRSPACVLIACRNGETEIGAAVARAVAQAPVFVVSDGSTDATAQMSRTAGAEVLELDRNVGKPSAIAKALRHFDIAARFETIAVIDDDTRIEPDFIRQALRRMRAGVAIVVGKTVSDWTHGVRWNPWVAARAFAYWKYQLFIRRGQSALNVMTCISGSNSLYRTSLLAQVVSEQTPYIVDDTYWTLETHRRKLGRIVYAPQAVAHIQDPTSLHDYYQQNLRWLWGTMQGINGHKVGRRFTLFDVTYLGLMFDWMLYVLVWPAMFAATIVLAGDPVRAVLYYIAGYLVWAAIGAIALRRWRLVLLAPALIAVDWIQRVNFIHALVKTLRQPRVNSCTWNSPKRYA